MDEFNKRARKARESEEIRYQYKVNTSDEKTLQWSE